MVIIIIMHPTKLARFAKGLGVAARLRSSSCRSAALILAAVRATILSV